ncbi:MAG TPA: [FeFe] hydrogenase H-cluster radical SAM maturase HydE [Phycisphaerales bacterium]|nr:[FeFe] hydrogenase H-cluster radical SAM maturase HydE [Phycisphaerales bacterium]
MHNLIDNLTLDAVEQWLRQDDRDALEPLWAAADAVRREHVGDAVHLRGLIEISNYCVRQCAYCGLAVTNPYLERYRMSDEEVLDCARQAHRFGYGTVVIQGGEDYGLETDRIAGLIRKIKSELPLAVTLSLGEREPKELAAWRTAGADRYLLRFETSDPELYARIHPPRPRQTYDRFDLLRRLRELGYEVGSGVMIGIPGQTYRTLARDILKFEVFDLDMIGVGPYIPNPLTPLGRGEDVFAVDPDDQVPNEEQMTYKVIALTRLVCPQANIPSTTALATINRDAGRELGLSRGANVVMPNVTPVKYRTRYEIYPGKACLNETAQACQGCLRGRIHAIGRFVGQGPGGRLR